MTDLPMSEGLRLTFAPTSEVLAALTQTVDAERQCCPFLRFDLTRQGSELVLTVGGPTEAQSVIRELFR